jgi:hypothetical protein
MKISYAAAVTTPVPRPEYSEAETENINLTSKDPSMLTIFINAYKLIKIENSITSIEVERFTLNTSHSNLSG